MNSDKIDRKNSIGVAFSGGGLKVLLTSVLFRLFMNSESIRSMFLAQARVRQWRQSLQWAVIPMK